jgi:hypothetical protein
MGAILSTLPSFTLYNFEQIQYHIKNKSILINTLDANNQSCLISGTISIEEEIKLLNHYLKTNKTILIIIYGKNNSDLSVLKKHKQLLSLGFTNIALYLGGLFEWLLLQDVFGQEHFPTTTKTIELLNYK